VVLPDCGWLCLQYNDGAKKQDAITSALEFLMLFSSGPQQEPPRELKGGGHFRGETAEDLIPKAPLGNC